MSRVSNHINRNIDQDRSKTDADIEILNINSPEYNTQNSEQHETSLNEALRFINAARHQNFTQNEGLERNYTDQRRANYGNIYENIELNNIPTPNIKNTTWDKKVKNIKSDRVWFSTINDYLDVLDNSSDYESENITDQKYFNIEQPAQDKVEIYDGTIYAVGNEGPMVIYSYKNKFYTSDAHDVLINSPNQESQSNSTDSISMENLNDESVNYEKSFYRVSTSFHPVIIPRLPLTYMLPTVTEILETTRQSPKIKELSDDVNGPVNPKPTNSWINNDDDSSQSEADDTTESNLDDSADESPDNKEENLHLLNKNNSKEHVNHLYIDIKDNTKTCDSKYCFDLPSTITLNPMSTDDSTRTSREKEISKQRNNYLDASDANRTNSESTFEKESRKSTHTNSAPIELSKHSSIPKHPFLINTETDKNESCFKRFLDCILCCK